MNTYEVWKKHPKFKYMEVSNFGQVRNCKPYSVQSNLKTKERSLTPRNKIYSLHESHGYKYVSYSEDGKGYTLRVHRLVAEIFIPNPDNLPYVNHKDGDKTNNNVLNLEWCSAKENTDHAIKNNLMKPKEHWEKVKDKMKCPESIFSPIEVYDKNNNFVAEFKSIADTARWIQSIGKSKGKCRTIEIEILKILTKKKKSAYGYVYFYKNKKKGSETIETVNKEVE